MTQVAAEELQKMNYLVSECNVIYYPQVRIYNMQRTDNKWYVHASFQLGFLLTLSEKEAQGNEQLFHQLNMELKASPSTEERGQLSVYKWFLCHFLVSCWWGLPLQDWTDQR